MINDTLRPNYQLHLNRRFILEINLFNYSLFSETIYREIKSIPANYKVILTNQIQIEKLFNIEDYYVDQPIPYKKCIDDLVNIFISLNKNSIHNGDSISFTSGFDGRTFVALAIRKKLDIGTYSFGTPSNDDFEMPAVQAAKLGIDHTQIDLGNDSYIGSFYKLGDKILDQSSLNSNLLQLHWPYAASQLSKTTSTLITGIFGSELFRAAHIPGQFTSPPLVDYFKHFDNDLWIGKISNASSLNLLNRNTFKNELDSILEDLSNYKKGSMHLNPNQRFYKYVFEETFRKFFGFQIIKPMRFYLNVISPYLNWDFIKALFKTELAGVNNDFFTHNPLKRYKGQLFYANLIKVASPELFKMTTGKGYAPKDLLTTIGKVKITSSFVKKRFATKTSKNELDNLAIISAIQYHKKLFLKGGVNSEYFSKKELYNAFKDEKMITSATFRDKIVETISLNHWINKNL